MERKNLLPIDALVPEILRTLNRTPNLVIEAQPGAGKTTRVPAALLGAVKRDVLVLEPRRIAARMAAARVAWELSEEVGATVGYQVRFDRVGGSGTRLHFLTEGVLTRRLVSDPELKGVGAVVLDEFHERHLETDLALALLKRLQQRRPDLRLVVMSATMDAEPVARFLGDCPVLRSSGRLFELDIEHLPYSAAPLHEQVRDAVAQLSSQNEAGDVLVFLPGAAEIRRAAAACDPVARQFERVVLPLYSDLPAAEQDRAVTPGPKRKVILSTNVAESSITIDGVTAVVDSGLARQAEYSPWTGLPTLRVGRISKASARQRAGRAARTAPGRVLRLYTQQDYHARREYDAPEISRSDLAQLCLTLRAMGMRDPGEIEWLDAPPQEAVRHAEELLDVLAPTERDAAALMRLPLHPRLSRMITAANERGVGRAACIAAALLSSGDRLSHTDLMTAMEQPLTNSARQQLRYLVRALKPAHEDRHDEAALLQSVLMGFPDRVAQRRSAGQVMLCNGVAADVDGGAAALGLMVVVDAENRVEKARPVVRLASALEAEWLLDLFPGRMREETVLQWNRQAARVESVSRLLYQELVLEETIGAPQDAGTAAVLLSEKALEAGLDRFVEPEALEDLMGRLEFAAIGTVDLESACRAFCQGKRSFGDLRSAAAEFVPFVEQTVGGQRLREDAPRTLRLMGGRVAKVHYRPGKTPWIASRLQDFFGMDETPRIGRNKVPVVLHLLAPNQRAVQTTTDLAGFWERLYPQVRRELMRRYPRHAWPENHRVQVK